ncbi:DUF2516 family protein [Actinomyces marmotae]|uniref:DUF2516 family protein n=1 Tax=Actinomyces marmotae TaxID=2737173 RepID=UPI001358F505|nr:DUF2516 family protein [Actinomyces marmotae]
MLTATANALAGAVAYLQLAFILVALALGAWAVVDSLTHRPDHYVAAGKRSKGFWVGLNAVGIIVVLLTGGLSALELLGAVVTSGARGIAGLRPQSLGLLGLLGMVANAVYLADARPALQVYRPIRVRSRIRRPGGGGPKGRWR